MNPKQHSQLFLVQVETLFGMWVGVGLAVEDDVRPHMLPLIRSTGSTGHSKEESSDLGFEC
jgi:hypothetical protein